MYLFIILGRYWQIAKHGFLVAWNPIKMRCSNSVFNDYLYQNLSQFSSTVLVQSNIWKKVLVLDQYLKIDLNFATSFLRKNKTLHYYLSFYGIFRGQKYVLTIFLEKYVNRPCLLYVYNVYYIYCKNSFGINSNYLSLFFIKYFPIPNTKD